MFFGNALYSKCRICFLHGSNNPNGVTGQPDRYSIHPFFIFKDLVTFFAFFYMFDSLLVLLVLPATDLSRIRGSQFRPLMKMFFWVFVVNFLILMWIGSQHPDSPYLEIGQSATTFYFAWFLLVVPFLGLFDNSLLDVATNKK